MLTLEQTLIELAKGQFEEMTDAEAEVFSGSETENARVMYLDNETYVASWTDNSFRLDYTNLNGINKYAVLGFHTSWTEL